RTNRALLDDSQLGGQGARAELNGQIICALNGEIAGNLAGPAEDRLADHGCRQHLVVKHDGERSSYVFLRETSECAGARLIEAECDDRLVGPLIEARLGIDKLIAANHRCFAQQIDEAVVLGGRIDTITGRRPGNLRFLPADARMNLVETQARRLTNESLEL